MNPSVRRSRSASSVLAVHPQDDRNNDLRDLAHLFTGAGIHVANCDSKGVFTKFFSITEKEVAIGKNARELFTGFDSEQLQEMVKDVAAKGTSRKAQLKLKNINHGRVLKDDDDEAKRYCKFDVTVSPRVDILGKIIGASIVFVDLGSDEDSEVVALKIRIRELEELNLSVNAAKNIAEDSEHAKADFLAMMSQYVRSYHHVKPLCLFAWLSQRDSNTAQWHPRHDPASRSVVPNSVVKSTRVRRHHLSQRPVASSDHQWHSRLFQSRSRPIGP